MKRKELRNEVVGIFIRWGLPTRQAAINEIVMLLDTEPCCGHGCCCNKVISRGGENNASKKDS